MSKTKIRAKELETVAISAIRPHPKNPNRNELPPLIDSIERVGFYGAITVQRGTGHIIAGNHRYMAAVASGMTEVPVIYLDVSDEEAMRMMLVDNRAAEGGFQDQAQVDALMGYWDDGKGYEELNKEMGAQPGIPQPTDGHHDNDQGGDEDEDDEPDTEPREPQPKTPREFDPNGAKRIISVGYSLADYDQVAAVMDKMRVDYGQGANGDALLVHLEQKFGRGA